MYDDRLKGWKEIAEFLHVRERTAQRWEHSLGLPVHRIDTARSAIVFASRREVDAWLRTAEGQEAVSAEFMAEPPAPGDHGSGSPAKGASDLADPVLSTLTVSEPADSASPHSVVLLDNLAPDGPPGAVSNKRLIQPRSLLLASSLVAVLVLGFVLFHDRLAPKPGSTAGSTPTRLAPTLSAKNSAVFPLRQTTPPAVTLRLTLVGGRTVRVTQLVGSLGTVSLAGHPPYAISAEATDDGVRIHVFRIQPATPDGSRHNEELAVVPLKPGDKKQLQAPTDTTTIEWLAPSPHRQPRS